MPMRRSAGLRGSHVDDDERVLVGTAGLLMSKIVSSLPVPSSFEPDPWEPSPFRFWLTTYA